MLSGISLVACGISVFGRPLSTTLDIRDSDQIPSLLNTPDWMGNAISFLPTDTSSSETSFGPSYSPQGPQEVNPNVATILGSDSAPTWKLGFDDTLTKQLGSDDTSTDLFGSGGNMVPGTGSTLEIASGLSTGHILKELNEMKQQSWQYCFYALMAGDNGLESKKFGARDASWDEFSGQFPYFRSGFALFKRPDGNVLSMMNLVDGCVSGEVGRGYCKNSENALNSFKPQWDNVVGQVFSMIPVGAVHSPSDLKSIAAKYVPDYVQGTPTQQGP